MAGRYAYDVLFDVRIGNVGLLICHLLTRFSRYIIDVNKRNQGYFVFEITFFIVLTASFLFIWTPACSFSTMTFVQGYIFNLNYSYRSFQSILGYYKLNDDHSPFNILL